nr:Fic family protein [Catenulispora pinisilvae]
MLYPTPELDADDQRVLGEIDRARESLKHQVAASPAKWTARLRKFLTADAVAASNSIEGFKVSTVDVEDLLDGERDVDVTDENRQETLAYQQMMTYVQTLHDSGDFSYSKGLLNGLHWMLQGHRHGNRKPAGQWRRGPVFVTDARDPSIAAYTAPDTADVPDLMHELIDWPNNDDRSHPLVRAAMAHLDLVSIHPWADGNGRMSRSLQTLMIAREDVLAPEFSSIEAWLGRPGNTWEYYRELARRGATYLPDQDVSSWIRFNLTAYHQQARTVQARTVPGKCGPSCQASQPVQAATIGSCPPSMMSPWPAESAVPVTSTPKISACSRLSGICATSSPPKYSNQSAAHAPATTRQAHGSPNKRFTSLVHP